MTGRDAPDRSVRRRRVLAVTGAGIAALAGCNSGGDGDDGGGGLRTTTGSDGNGTTGSGNTGGSETETADWRMYRGGPGQAAYTPGSGPGGDAAVEWTWTTPNGEEFVNPSGNWQVAVEDDTAYVATSVAYGEGTSRSYLYGLDAATGDRRWVYEYDWGEAEVGSEHSMPVVVDGRAIFRVSGYAGDRWEYVGVDDGEAAWTAPPTPEDEDKRAALEKSPLALSDGTVLAAVGTTSYRRLAPSVGEFSGDAIRVGRTPTVADDSQFAQWGETFQRRPLGGEGPDWSFDWRERAIVANQWTPAVYADGTAYFGVGIDFFDVPDGPEVPDPRRPRLFAVDAETGTENWTRVLETERGERQSGEANNDDYWYLHGRVAALAVGPETVYAYTTTGDVAALSPDDGSTRWRTPVTDRNRASVPGGIVACPDGVYVALPDGVAHVSGDGEASSLASGDYETATLSVAGGRLYVARSERIEVYG
ncbi:outer membrane protein assembly factor BamB family protein [Halostella litorea]|uniref:outer membrane protein assembly factor BamB family protein n=1 Tax=Halostella litorea TaxID=2528831 RepID=UPI0010933584|nr:PQQ-binding-like beta-propeller repeat protein [Halostella litorea]